jgi:alkylation response protein AidB-like acyl-CoA dehydrogenase
VTSDATSAIAIAHEIAGKLLFPAALDVDAGEIVPRPNLDAIAEEGLYGVVGPRRFGGLEIPMPAFCSIIEALAGGCLTTAFVWIQHHTPVRALTASPNYDLRDEWLPLLCSGERRAGIALGGMRAGPSQVVARPVEGGWLFDGDVPYVTGWGLIDVFFIASRTLDNATVISALVPAADTAGLSAERLTLLAANASSTVRLRIKRLFVPAEMVVSDEPHHPPPDYDGGGRPNGSLSLGVASRCLTLLGPSALDSELSAKRDQLDQASDAMMSEARAAAVELAQRSAAALVVQAGSRSLFPRQHAQRLAREAVFLAVFGSRPAIKAALLRRLTRSEGM